MLHRLLNVLWIFALAFAVIAVVDVDQANAEEVLASWYGPGFEGLPTASGEPYDPSGYTAAHKTLPLGTELVVSYGGRSVPVTINDRGPYVGSRELDLSQAAAQTLGLDEAGVDYVDYTYADSSYAAPETTYTEPVTGTPYTEPVATEPAYTEPVVAEQVHTESVAAESGYTEPADPAMSGGYEASATPDAAAGGGYVAAPGDTLSEVAMQLGTTTEYLASYNGIPDPDYIQSGQTIYY